MCLQNFIKKFQTVYELNFTVFRIWTSAKLRPIPNVIWLSHGLHHVNINMYAKFHHNIPLSSRDRAISLFQDLELGKASIDEKCHFAISWVNIKVYAKVYQNIPLSSRAIFTFSEFEPRQRLGQSQMTFDNLLCYILSISLRMQNFIKIFQTV